MSSLYIDDQNSVMKQITIYTSPVCGYCSLAKQLFQSLEIPYEEKSVMQHADEVDRLSQEHHWRTVPMILIGEEFIGGYDDVKKLHDEGLLQDKLGA